MRICKLKHAVALALVVLLASPVFAQKPGKGGGGSTGPTYTWTWLGTFGGAESAAGKITNTGDITGSARYPDGTSSTCIWFADGGREPFDFEQYVFDLGLLAPYDPTTETGVSKIMISDLNDAREIVGTYWVADKGSVQRKAYYLALEPVNELGLPVPLNLITFDTEEFDSWNFSHRINQFGVVIGTKQFDASSPFESYVWTPASGMQFLGVIGTPSGINSYGVICGGYGRKGWKYVPGTGLVPIFSSEPVRYNTSDINDAGQIVGSYKLKDDLVSAQFVYRVEPNGSFVTIKLTNKITTTYAVGINSSGDVLGAGTVDGVYRPYLYTNATGVIQLLNHVTNLPAGLNTHNLYPRAINDSGHIVGYYSENGGSGHKAFLLTRNP